MIFEETDITDIVVRVFYAPMVTDSGTDGLGGQGYLTGIESDITALIPKPGLGVLAPGVAGDANGGFDMLIPAIFEVPFHVEGFDQAIFVSPMAIAIRALEAVDRVVVGRDRVEGVEQGLLIGFDLGDESATAGTGCLECFFGSAWRRP